ncbi:MAG TPA: hypothetical protein ENI96_02905 [Sedimenticola thiotaurini]|uniref:Exonuclease domain-containing protein n=1 Tax=Sedimenticola thiotaurini TaxID=1543721 RepID=A0A831RM00_9GAMM|nr:hypothetical protein [Sedimenticola thiotaurini]
MIPAVIDIEASGFGPDSYPIEVGVVMPDGSRHCYLVRPEPEWTFWSRQAERVHGIPRQRLLQRGHSVTEVARLLNRLLADSTVYSDAWGHDLSWIGKLYDAAGVRQLFRLESLRRLLTEEQAARWHPTKEAVLRQTRLERHRASADAMILQLTWKRISLPAAAGAATPQQP